MKEKVGKLEADNQRFKQELHDHKMLLDDFNTHLQPDIEYIRTAIVDSVASQIE